MRSPINDHLGIERRIWEELECPGVEAVPRSRNGLPQVRKLSGVVVRVPLAVDAYIEPVEPLLPLDDQQVVLADSEFFVGEHAGSPYSDMGEAVQIGSTDPDRLPIAERWVHDQPHPDYRLT